MQNVDHADVSCLLLHYFFIKDFGREKEKEKIGGGICLWLVWVYVEKCMVMMMLIGSLLLFVFSFSWYMYIYMYPLATQKQRAGIDDDMNNEHVHFFVFPSFFLVLSVPTLGTRYLLRGIPPR